MINFIHFPIWISFSVPTFSPKGTYLHSDVFIYFGFLRILLQDVRQHFLQTLLSSLVPKTMWKIWWNHIWFICASFIFSHFKCRCIKCMPYI